MAEQTGTVIGIGDYKSIQILFSPELQVDAKLTQYRNVCD